jgi:hypothetical protein
MVSNRHLPARRLGLLGFALLVSVSSRSLAPRAAEADPPFEKLLELNAQAVFGGETTLNAKEGRVVIRFPGKGLFHQAFTVAGGKGRGFFSDVAEVKDGAMRKVLIEGAESGFSVVGRDAGRAVSRFELADDIRLSFKLKIPSLPANAALSITVNQLDARSFLQSSFFQDIVWSDAGKRKRKATELKAYAGNPSKWFNQKSPGVPFEIVFKEKKLAISMTGKSEKEKDKDEVVELVKQEGIENPARGKIVIDFRGMSFLISDLVVEGKYDRSWVETDLARLKKEGKLKVKDAEPEAPKDKPKEKTKDSKVAGGDANAPPPLPPKRKLGNTNVGEPDPEAGLEL